MRYGTVIVGIFVFAFLMYSNAFLMKRRQREFGIFNILGMEKQHLGHVLFLETMMAVSYTHLMDKIYKQLMTTLDGIGVKPIEAVGQEFNPDFHNAVMHEENEEAGENTICLLYTSRCV